MKPKYLPVLLIWAWSLQLFGQVVPAAEGPTRLPLGGSLNVALRYAHLAEKEPVYSAFQTGAVSLDLDYVNNNPRRPFRMMYTGGRTWMIAGPRQVTGIFQRLFLGQSFTGRRWSGAISDDFGYLPAAPTTGFSGIPGIGEPIGTPNPGPDGGPSILTLNTHTLENTTYGEVERRLGRAFSVRGNAGWGFLHYPDADGLDSNSSTGSIDLADRLSALTNLSIGYRVSRFTYSSHVFSLMSQSTYLGVSHSWKHLTTDLSAGPEWLRSSSTAIPSSLGATVDASLIYTSRFGAASLIYSRGISNGSGYYPGARVDRVNAGLFRDFRKTLTLGITASQMRTTPVVGEVIDSTFGGVQVTRRMGRSLGVFGNYTALRQASQAALPENVLSGVSHVFSAGVEYTLSNRHTRQ